MYQKNHNCRIMCPSVIIAILFKVLFLINKKIVAESNIFLPQNINDDVQTVKGCIKDIIDVFNFKTAVFVWDDSIETSTNRFVDYEEIFKELKVPLLLLFEEIEVKDNEIFTNKYAVVVIYYMDDCETILNYNWTSLDRGIKHLIIIPEHCIDGIAVIGKDVETYHVTFLLLNKLNMHDLITFIPKITPYECDVSGISKPLHINSCSNASLRKDRNKIFPQKHVENLEGCPLDVGIYILPPFTLTDDTEKSNDLDELNKVYGSDIELLNIIAERVNSTFIYRNMMGGTKKCVQLLNNGSVDLCAGGLTMNGKDLGFTDSYTSQNFVWMYAVNRSSKVWWRITSRISTMYPFFLFYISYCVLFYISSYVHGVSVSFSDSLLYGWGAYFGAILLPSNYNLTQQILNLCFMISSLYIILFTSSEIYSYFTLELAPKVYRTDHELLSSGLKVFLNPSWNYNLSSLYSKEELQHLSTYDCYGYDDCEIKTVKHNGITITSIGKFIIFQDESAENFEARVLKLNENVFTRPVVMVMRKDLSILNKVRDLTRRVLESGMYDKFYRDGIGANIIARAKMFSKNIRMEDYSCKVGCRVSMDKIMPVFCMWVLGCFVALIVFLTELYRC